MLPDLLPDDADPALAFVATLTPSQRAVLSYVAACAFLQLDALTDQQRAVAAGLAASDMGLLARTSGVSVVALAHDLRISPTQGFVLTPLGDQVMAVLQEAD